MREYYRAARPWGLLQFGLLALIAGILLALSTSSWVALFVGLVFAVSGVLSMFRAVVLFRKGPR